jgi:hypothetical protein
MRRDINLDRESVAKGDAMTLYQVRALRVPLWGISFLLLWALPTALAQDPVAAPVMEPFPVQPRQRPEPGNAEPDRTKRSYVIPAVEIIGLNFALNRFDRQFLSDPETFNVTGSTIRRNLEGPWVVDDDPYYVNQFLHPYHGSVYHTLARSAGVGFWKSTIYTFLGSALWEIAGETEPPSINDQVASGIGGTFFGESLFRMASLTLEKSNGVPQFWRAIGATAISPMTGFNRLVFGNRFDDIFPGHEPAFFTRWNFGSTVAERRVKGTSRRSRRNEGLVEFAFAYGLPGKLDYNYNRPFDYFNFEFSASTSNNLENIFARGLLAGKGYGAGTANRGVWGLYGSYDYMRPDVFRVSSTALSVGTTAQSRFSGITFQGTALAGLGYAAGGTLEGTVGERDYNYGLTPQSLLTSRFIFGKFASLDITGRGYRITRALSTADGGWENVGRADASLTVRLFGPHALTVRYLVARRFARYPDLGLRNQRRDTVGVFYTLLRDRRMGGVDTSATGKPTGR